MADEIVDVGYQPLAGLTVVITGAIPGYTRDTASEAVTALGGKVAGSVSAKTGLLIAGENAGSKLEKAEKLGVPVIGPEAFATLLADGVVAALASRRA